MANYPLVETFEVVFSNQCNLSCKYCFVNQTPQIMTLDNLKKTIQFIENYPNKKTPDEGFKIHLFGGECLLNKDLVKYFIENISPSYPVIVFTNVTTLDDDFLHFAYNHKNVSFNFSLDGCRDAHNAARVNKSSQGTYDIVVEKLNRYAEIFRIPHEKVYVKAVLSKYNIQYLKETIRQMAGLKYSFSFTLDRENHWTKEELEFFLTQFQEAADVYVELFDELPPTDLFVQGLAIASTKRVDFCHACHECNQMCIAPSLKLYTCSNFINSNLSIGSIDSGVDINGVALTQLRATSMITIPECMNCNLFPHHNCWGQCPGAVQSTKGTTLTVIPEVCQLLRGHLDVCYSVYNRLKNNPKFIRELNNEKHRGQGPKTEKNIWH